MSEPERRWTVPAGERGRLAELLPDFGEVARDGRLFVNGRRVNDADVSVAAGDLVELYPRRRTRGTVRILGECCGWVAVEKPADLPTEPDHYGSDSVITEVAALAAVPAKELHALSRLDVGVSGVVVLAHTKAARGQAERLRRAGHFRRGYAAIATGRGVEEGAWSTPVRGRDARTRFLTCHELRHSAQPARLLALAPLTGRTHQLRVQAAEAGVPFVGDRRYGGMVRLVDARGRVTRPPRILLHCVRVALGNPAGRVWTIHCGLPAAFGEAWTVLGGAGSALEVFTENALWARLEIPS
jgi:23S rRNA-/tRNA-specific pseudouridylate synthase